MNNLEIGRQIAHKGNCYENANKTYVVKIVGFDGLAIEVETKRGTRYFINKWDVCHPVTGKKTCPVS